MKTYALTLVCFVSGAFVGSLAAQPPMPKPGPEHELLKKWEGNWDATVNAGGKESKGTSAMKVGLGGFWLTVHFKGDFAGAPFEGTGVTGYDPMKKKYVTSWADSMSPSLMLMEGSFDKEEKTYTEVGEGPGPDGKPAKWKSVYDFKDNDTIVFTMYLAAGDKDQEMFKITYKRKK